MAKTKTHWYRRRDGIVVPYYTAIIEPLPCKICEDLKRLKKKEGQEHDGC